MKFEEAVFELDELKDINKNKTAKALFNVLTEIYNDAGTLIAISGVTNKNNKACDIRLKIKRVVGEILGEKIE